MLPNRKQQKSRYFIKNSRYHVIQLKISEITLPNRKHQKSHYSIEITEIVLLNRKQQIHNKYIHLTVKIQETALRM